MDTVEFWPNTCGTCRNQGIRQFSDRMGAIGTQILTSQSSNIELRINCSPKVTEAMNESKTMITANRFGLSPYRPNGRPCLAGTQTLQHQLKERQAMDTFNTSILSLGTCDFTQDSSGIDSFLLDQDNCNKTNDRHDFSFGWPTHNLMPMDQNTNAISAENYNIIRPVSKSTDLTGSYCDYSRLDNTDNNINQLHEGSSSGISENSGTEEFDYDAMIAQTQLFATRQPQIIEDRMEEVIRYVEERTECVSPSTIENTNNDLQQSAPTISGEAQTQSLPTSIVSQAQINHQQQTQQFQEKSPSAISQANSNFQLNQIAQLQHLYQRLTQLLSSKYTKPGENGPTESQLNELLARFENTVQPPLTKTNEHTTTSNTMNGVKSWQPTLNDQLTKLQSIQQDNMFAKTVEQTPNCKISNPTQNYSTTTTFSNAPYVDLQASLTKLLTPPNESNVSGVDGNIPSRCLAALQAVLASINPGILSSIITLLNNPDPSSTCLQSPSSIISALALLASLLSASNSNIVGNQQVTQAHESYNTSNNTLAALINNLQTMPVPQYRPIKSEEQTKGIRLGSTRDVDGQYLNANINCQCLDHHGLQGTTNLATTTVQKHTLSEELSQLAAPYQQLLASAESDINRAADVYRNSASTVAQKSEAAYHWSGKLPVRVYRSMTFSRKLFLGGVPWDSTTEDLIMTFSKFGNVSVSWPQKETGCSQTSAGRVSSPKGYCYLIFEHESSVADLVAHCVHNPSNGGDYYKISSPKFKSKDVQVIPWVISDSQYTKSGPYRPDAKRTVFVGALHAMITAEALVTIMNDLFGNVVFAALDTDKYKYPIGSGRVAFSSHKSYMRAITANFVDVRTPKFMKTIQIDPYLEDAMCNSCFAGPGIYFCRAFECFRYFCPTCWQLWHNSTEALSNHNPLRRTFKPISERQWTG